MDEEQILRQQFLLTVNATLGVMVRPDGLIGLAMQKEDGACVVARMTSAEAFDLHRMVLEAAEAAAKRGIEA